MRFLRKHWKRCIVAGLLFAISMSFVLAWWSGSEIASPSRRVLMDYHREFLTNQAAHGIRVVQFNVSDGTPCLCVTPAGSPGERGINVRKQLLERGINPPSFGAVVGTLVLVHGRKGRKEDYLPIAERLCAAGFRCLIPDLPGHGDHPVTVATYGVRESALPGRVLRESAEKFGFAPEPSGLMGMSMGGSVAVHAASRDDAPWKALVVVSSFDSFPAAIEGQALRHAGVTLGPLWARATDTVYRWKTGISIQDVQPFQHAAAIRIPTMVAHGAADRVISPDSGHRLFDALPSGISKKWVKIPYADHDNVLITSYPIYAEIAEWMSRHVAGSPTLKNAP